MAEGDTAPSAGPSTTAPGVDSSNKDGKTKRRSRNRSGKAAKKEAELKAKATGKVAGEANESKGRSGKKSKNKQKKSKKEKTFDEDGRVEGIPKVKLKVVVRRLPPNLPEDIFWKAVSPWATRGDANTDPDTASGSSGSMDLRIEQGYFVSGKLKDNQRQTGARSDAGVQHTLSRAYLRFRSMETLINFHKGFDGHLFRDAKGNEYIAVVEMAPFQRMLNDAGKRKRPDASENTIAADSEYKAFVESLGETDKSNGGEQMSAEKTDAQLMAHLTSLHEANQMNKNVKSTPLLDHLRRQRTAKAEAAALKSAKKYLNKNHGAYAATTTPNASKTADTASRKTKGKGKDKKTQHHDSATPTGPRALQKGKKEADQSSSAKKSPAAEGAKVVAAEGNKRSAAEKPVGGKGGASRPKEVKGAPGQPKVAQGDTKVGMLTRANDNDVGFNPPTGPSAGPAKAPRPPRRPKVPKAERTASQTKGEPAS